MFKKISEGTTRTVFVVAEKFVVKIPKGVFIWGGIKWNMWEFIVSYFYAKKYRPLLTPTHFSLGLFSIQKFEKGRRPTVPEIDDLIKRVFRTEGVRGIDPHCFRIGNFIINESGWHIVDYGFLLGRKFVAQILFKETRSFTETETKA